MKRAVILLIATGALVCLAIGMRGGEGGDAYASDGHAFCFGMGKQLAGGWHMVLDVGGGPTEWVLALTADGVVMTNNSSRGAGANQLRTSFGSWRRIGRNTIALTLLVLIEDPDGILLNYEKVVSELSFERNEFSGPVAGIVYAPTQDPLDPDQAPLVTLTGSATGRRIQAETLGE